MPDPVARAIGQLLDHLQAVDGRLEGMCGALKDLGSNYCAKDCRAARRRLRLREGQEPEQAS
jgi:serine O-acetyltransferase